MEDNKFEVERIADMRLGRDTRYERVHRQLLVYGKGYDDPSWADQADLNCGALLQDFGRNKANRNRFKDMQSHEEES